MKGFMGYPIIKESKLHSDTNAWVKGAVSNFHLQHFPNTTASYTLFIEGDYPTTDCEGSDCCMIGNTLWWGLHKIEKGTI